MDDSVGAVPSVTRNRALTAAVVALLVQGLGLVGLAGWLVVLAFTREETSVGAGFAEAVIAAGVGVLLIAAARSMHRGRSGLRGAAVFVELMYLPLGYYLAKADLWVFAIAAWLVGVGTIALLMLPSSRRSVGLD
ncbi:MAG: hypothetical protein ACRD0P_16240 [Stackebrandtia sp.]